MVLGGCYWLNKNKVYAICSLSASSEKAIQKLNDIKFATVIDSVRFIVGEGSLYVQVI